MGFFSWKQALFSRTIWFCLLVVVISAVIAAFAPVIATHDPTVWGATNYSLPPRWVHTGALQGNAEHLLGTDRYGRDIFSRFIYGTRTAFILALIAVPLAALIGTAVGLLAGDAGGKLDALLMGFSDTVQSVSGIMFAVMVVLILRSILTPSWINGVITLVIGFAAVSWVSLARLVRVNVMQIKSQLYIEAAVSIGAKRPRILIHHILPNLMHVILVWIINNIPAVILLEAVLGYIGVPITSATTDNEFSTISWGGLFFSGRSALSSNPWMVVLPSLYILLISMSFILLADKLRSISRSIN